MTTFLVFFFLSADEALCRHYLHLCTLKMSPFLLSVGFFVGAFFLLTRLVPSFFTNSVCQMKPPTICYMYVEKL